MANCASCGKKMIARGGQYVCMNDACPNYLIGTKPKVSGLRAARSTAKDLAETDQGTDEGEA